MDDGRLDKRSENNPSTMVFEGILREVEAGTDICM